MRRTRYASVAAIVCGAGASLFACGDSSEVDPLDVDGGLPEAAADSSPTRPDAALGDATHDGDAAPPSRCSREGWCLVDVPEHQDLSAVWGDGQGAVWTAGGCIDKPGAAAPNAPKLDGCILRWNGAVFEKVFGVAGEPVGRTLSVIWGSGPTDLWAGGRGGLFHGTGATSASIVWRRVDLGESIAIESIWGTGANDIWLTGNASSAGRVLHYTGASADAGAGWIADPGAAALFPVASFPTRVFGSAPDDVWVTGSGQERDVTRIAHLGPASGGGVAWSDVTPPSSVFTIRVSPYGGPGATAYSTAGFAATAGQAWLAPFVLYGDGYRSYPARLSLGASDGGDAGGAPELTSFTDVGHYTADGAWDTIGAFWGTSPSDVWMVADNGRLRHWDGTTWTLAFTSATSAPILATLKGIWGPGAAAPGEIWVVGQGVVLHRASGKQGAK